jgi:hypothetical protein
MGDHVFKDGFTGWGIFFLCMIIGIKLGYSEGWAGLLSIVVSIFISAFVVEAMNIHRERREHRKLAREREEQAKAPCQHGIVGAVQNPQLCTTCFHEKEEIEAAKKAALEAQRQERREQEQRRHREWVRQMRLPEYLRTVHPREFERIVCALFRRLGCQRSV